MNFKYRTTSEIFVAINIVLLLVLGVLGMAILGSDFFHYLGKGMHYIYYFIFKRAFDFKTFLVVLISLGVIGLISYYIYNLANKPAINLSDVHTPITIIALPFLVLVSIRANSIGLWKEVDTVLKVFTIIFLVLYAGTSLVCLYYAFKKAFKRHKKYSPFENPKMAGGKHARELASRILIYAILIIISIIWIAPFVYLILQSFAVKYETSLLIPKQWTLANYSALINNTVYPFWRWYLNTLVIALIVSVLNTVLTLVSAYAFSRLQFKTRKGYMKLILIIGMFPGFLGMIVTYYMLKQINLANGISGLFGLVLVYISGCVMNYYVAKGFFDTISRSLDEAAMIDGANKNTIFWKVIMPLSKPIVVYTILLAFIAPWGDYMLASVMAGGKTELFNVAVGLQQMLSKEAGSTYFPIFCAAGVVVSIPIMILFFCLQGYYVEGVTGGAVKG